ncbi:autophagy-related protein [Syncephalis plumigaleata]|nr:autophagy-related protein [Syncephalis plumigaleata]
MTSNKAELFPIELTTDRSLLKDVLRALLHTILFHRVFITIRPMEVEALDTFYPAIDDPDIERAIEDKLRAFARHLDATGLDSAQMVVGFFEKRTKNSCMLGEWPITVTCVRPRDERDQAYLRQAASAQLRKLLAGIVHTVETHREHVPAITTNEGNPFPYQVGTS